MIALPSFDNFIQIYCVETSRNLILYMGLQPCAVIKHSGFWSIRLNWSLFFLFFSFLIIIIFFFIWISLGDIYLYIWKMLLHFNQVHICSLQLDSMSPFLSSTSWGLIKTVLLTSGLLKIYVMCRLCDLGTYGLKLFWMSPFICQKNFLRFFCMYKCSCNLDQDLEVDRNCGLRIKENFEAVHLFTFACVLLSKFTATLIWMRIFKGNRSVVK